MVEITAFMVLGIWALVTIGALVVGHAGERKEWQAERKDLLDRIMARDYQQYTEGEAKIKGLSRPVSVVPVDELVAKIEEREAMDRYPAGMPV